MVLHEVVVAERPVVLAVAEEVVFLSGFDDRLVVGLLDRENDAAVFVRPTVVHVVEGGRPLALEGVAGPHLLFAIPLQGRVVAGGICGGAACVGRQSWLGAFAGAG